MANPNKLPERIGKNYFAGKTIRDCRLECGFSEKIKYDGFYFNVTEDSWNSCDGDKKDYSYEVVQDDDEVIQTYLRNRIEYFRKQALVECRFFWLKKDNGRINSISTCKQGLSLEDLYLNNINFGVRTQDNPDVDFYVYGTQIMIFAPSEERPESPLLFKDILSVSDNKIVFVDTDGELPVRHTIKYTDFEYKPEYTGMFRPLRNGANEDTVPDGITSYMTCNYLFGDDLPHKMSNTGAWTSYCWIIDKDTFGSDMTFNDQRKDDPRNLAQVSYKEEDILSSEELILEPFWEGFYNPCLEDYRNKPNTLVSFIIENPTDEENMFRVHIAEIEEKEVFYPTLIAPKTTRTFTYSIKDLEEFCKGKVEKIYLELFCESPMALSNFKIIQLKEALEE